MAAKDDAGDGKVVTIEGHKRRRALGAAREFLADAIALRDRLADEEAALEAGFGRFFRMEQDFEAHGKAPYLMAVVTLPYQIDARQRAAWERRGAIDVSVTGHLARERPDSVHTMLAPDGSNQFWTSRISLRLTPEQALALMTRPDRAKVAREFGRLRTEETCVQDAFDMAGMRRFEIERHPAYEAIFGEAGRCFEVMVSNRHPDPARPPMSLRPWRYATCRDVADVQEAIRLIGRLERKAALAGAENVVDLEEGRGGPRM